MRSFLFFSIFCLATSLIAPPERRLPLGPPRVSIRLGSDAERMSNLRERVANQTHGEDWVFANVELAERLTLFGLTASTSSEFIVCLQNIESTDNQLGRLVKDRVDRIIRELASSFFEPYFRVPPRTRRGGQLRRREESPER